MFYRCPWTCSWHLTTSTWLSNRKKSIKCNGEGHRGEGGARGGGTRCRCHVYLTQSYSPLLLFFILFIYLFIFFVCVFFHSFILRNCFSSWNLFNVYRLESLGVVTCCRLSFFFFFKILIHSFIIHLVNFCSLLDIVKHCTRLYRYVLHFLILCKHVRRVDIQ